jgi:hypothetical protein
MVQSVETYYYLVYLSAQTAIIKYHTIHGVDNRNLLSHVSLNDKIFMIKISSKFFFYEGHSSLCADGCILPPPSGELCQCMHVERKRMWASDVSSTRTLIP